MATIIYVTGNGYSCGCCRQTYTDYLDFDPEDIQPAINECIQAARGSEWDFYIEAIRGLGEDMSEDELERLIKEAIDNARDDAKRKQTIKDTYRQLEEINRWFEQLESTKILKETQRKVLQAKLVELGAVI